PNSPDTGPLPVGSFVFTATYSGDGNFNGSTSDAEPLAIGPGSSNVATVIMAAPNGPPINGVQPLGTSVFDTATVTAPVTRSTAPGITPTGTATSTFPGAALATLTVPQGWDQAGLTGQTTWTHTLTLHPPLPILPTSPPTGPLPAGSFVFTATYSGDTNFDG